MSPEKLDLPQGTLDLLILKRLLSSRNMVGPFPSAFSRSPKTSANPARFAVPALHRLERRGWVKARWGASENNRRAKYYELTAAGRKTTRPRTKRLEQTRRRRSPSSTHRLGIPLRTKSYLPGSHPPVLLCAPDFAAWAIAILLLMFSEAVLDHFQNPRNAGELPSATSKVEVSIRFAATFLQLAVRVEKDLIAEARFLAAAAPLRLHVLLFSPNNFAAAHSPKRARLPRSPSRNCWASFPAATFHGAELAADRGANAGTKHCRKLSLANRYAKYCFEP